MMITNDEPMFTHVEKMLHISSDDKTTGTDDNFTIVLNDTYRQVRKVELLNANITFNMPLAHSEIFLTIKELPGNFSSEKANVNSAFCNFSRDPSSGTLLQNARTTYFVGTDLAPANALPGLGQISIRLHTADSATALATFVKECHFTFRITYLVRRMPSDAMRLTGRMLDGRVLQ